MAISSINSGMSSYSAKDKVEYFMNMSDEELLRLSHIKTRADKRTRKDIKSTNAMMKTIPFADSVIAASETKLAGGAVGFGALSTSLSAFLGRLGMWGFFIGGFKVLDKMFNKAAEKSETISELDRSHPLAKPLSEIGIMGAAYFAGTKYKSKLVNLIPKSIRKATFKEVIKLKRKINSSKFSKEIYKPILDNCKKFAVKFPKMAAFSKSIKPLIIPAMIVAAVIKSSITVPNSYHKRVAENFDSLKTQQDCMRALVDMKENNNDIDF